MNIKTENAFDFLNYQTALYDIINVIIPFNIEDLSPGYSDFFKNDDTIELIEIRDYIQFNYHSTSIGKVEPIFHLHKDDHCTMLDLWELLLNGIQFAWPEVFI